MRWKNVDEEKGGGVGRREVNGVRLVEKWGKDFGEVGMGMGSWKFLGEIRVLGRDKGEIVRGVVRDEYLRQ